MKKKKLFFALLCAGALLLGLAACGGAADSGSVTLTLMGKGTDLQRAYMARIFRLYEEETGNRLMLEPVEDADFEAAVAERYAEGNPPDILLHFNNSGLEQLDGQFCLLDDAAWAGDLTEGALSYCQDGGGNLLGLPFWENSVSGCYYNRTLLDSLGLRAASTQAEFDALCRALAGIGRTPLCWPADGCSWMYQFGLDPVFADDPDLLEQLNAGEVDYADIPAVLDMAEWIAGAAEKGWFGDSFLDTGWSDIGPALGSGEAAMVLIWDTWFHTGFAEGQKYGPEDFALMPAFLGTAENGTYEGGNLNMMLVSRDGKNREEALAFLDFCAAPGHYNAAFDGVPTVSCFRGQTTNIQSDMVTRAMGSILERQRVSTAEPRIVGYSQEETAAAFRSLLTGEISPEECVREMDAARLAQRGRKDGTG